MLLAVCSVADLSCPPWICRLGTERVPLGTDMVFLLIPGDHIGVRGPPLRLLFYHLSEEEFICPVRSQPLCWGRDEDLRPLAPACPVALPCSRPPPPRGPGGPCPAPQHRAGSGSAPACESSLHFGSLKKICPKLLLKVSVTFPLPLIV